MTFHETLDSALSDIAERSFDEDATVTPVEGGYEVTDDFSTAYAGDSIQWTYDGGMELPADILENSRLHKPAEYYDGAHHIRYNLPAAVEALESGHAVTFAYTIVDAWCERGGGAAMIYHDNQVCTECDSYGSSCVGWVLLAYDHGPMASAAV